MSMAVVPSGFQVPVIGFDYQRHYYLFSIINIKKYFRRGMHTNRKFCSIFFDEFVFEKGNFEHKRWFCSAAGGIPKHPDSNGDLII